MWTGGLVQDSLCICAKKTGKLNRPNWNKAKNITNILRNYWRKKSFVTSTSKTK